MDDYRVKVGFFDHPKSIRLERCLGAGAVLSLLRLWDFCAQYRIDGVLSGLDNEDVAAAARWPDDADKFVDILIRCKFLDRDSSGTLAVHDWLENNPYVASRGDRVAKAKAAAAARWGTPAQDADAQSNAKSCSEHAASTIEQCPPTPTPTPTPTQPNLCCCWGAPREKSTGDLNRAIEAAVGRSIPPKWFPLAESISPFSQAEIDHALAEAGREPKPNAGLVIRILERYRNTRPAEVRSRDGPPRERSTFREVTEQALQEAREYDQRKLREAHDQAAGLLPAKGQ